MPLQVTSTLLGTINTNIRRRFNTGLGRAPQLWREFATEVASSSSGELFTFMLSQLTMREWIGERVITDLKGYDFEIRNRKYERTIEVKRERIEDDQLGQYGMEAEVLGDAAGRLSESMIFDLIKAAHTTNCYDGQFMVDTDHPVGSGTVSNKGTTALAADGVAYSAARAAMMNFKDADGVPLNIVPNVLLAPPALEGVGRNLLQSPSLAAGGANIWNGTATLIISPMLTDVTDWFLFDTTKPMKPFILLDRTPAEITAQTALTDEAVFSYDVYRWGARVRKGAGYALWQLMYGNIVAG